jgi:hypothetical protein
MPSRRIRPLASDLSVELFIRDLVGELEVSQSFVERMTPMVRSIFLPQVPAERRPALMSIAAQNILRQAVKATA